MKVKALFLLFITLVVYKLYADSGSGISSTSSKFVGNENPVIDYVHHKIYEGASYTFNDYDTDVDASEQLVYVITTPNTSVRAHFVEAITHTLVAQICLYENITATGTDARTPVNRKRDSVNTATVTIHEGASSISGGTLIESYYNGISTGTGVNRVTFGGRSDNNNELILKPNTKYLLEIESDTDNQAISLILDWYEES